MWFIDRLKDLTILMDWKQFIPSLVATFVGIFVPFWIQAHQDKKRKRKDALLKLSQIYKELTEVKSKIIDHEMRAENGSVFIEAIKAPIGDGLLKTKEIQLLADLQKHLNKKFKRNKTMHDVVKNDWHKRIIEVYADIVTYNILWNKFAEQIFFMRNHFVCESNEPETKKIPLTDREQMLYDQAYQTLQTIEERRKALALEITGESGNMTELLKWLKPICEPNEKNLGEISNEK